MYAMEKRIKYDKYDSGKTFFLSVVVPQLAGIVLVIALMMVASFLGTSYEALIEKPWVLAISAIIAQLAFVGVFFGYNKKAKVDYVKATGFSVKTSWRNYVSCVIIAVVALFGFNNLIGVFNQGIVEIGYTGSQAMPLPLNNAGWLIYNLIFLAFAPAVFEELLFRGIIYNGLKNDGKIKAVFISALLFTVMHGSLVQTIYPFMLGLVLGFVMMKTENIFCTILIHFLNNTIVIVSNYIYEVNQITGETVNMLTFKEIALAILYAIVAGVIVWLVIKFVMKAKQKKKMSLNDIKIDENQVNGENLENVQTISQPAVKENKFMTYGIVVAVVVYLLDIFIGFMW